MCRNPHPRAGTDTPPEKKRCALYAEMLIQSAANCQDGRKLAFYIRARLTGIRTPLRVFQHCLW
jgi:hypothetical protein